MTEPVHVTVHAQAVAAGAVVATAHSASDLNAIEGKLSLMLHEIETRYEADLVKVKTAAEAEVAKVKSTFSAVKANIGKLLVTHGSVAAAAALLGRHFL